MITREHIKWAKQFDWYHGRCILVDTGKVGIIVKEDDGSFSVFSKFTDLVLWAGY